MLLIRRLILKYHYPYGEYALRIVSLADIELENDLIESARGWLKSRVWYDHNIGDTRAQFYIALPQQKPFPFNYFGKDIFNPGTVPFGLRKHEDLKILKEIFLWLCHINEDKLKDVERTANKSDINEFHSARPKLCSEDSNPG